jgi:hypothetical protein
MWKNYSKLKKLIWQKIVVILQRDMYKWWENIKRGQRQKKFSKNEKKGKQREKNCHLESVLRIAHRNKICTENL